jgi:DNA polymerase-3 subunit alpha/error-prone DNA polymerase
VGIEFRCNHQLRYIGSQNANGLAEMNRFLTKHNFENSPLPLAAPEFNDVCIIYPFEMGQAF